MAETTVRFFEPPRVRTFRLSPLYAAPGRYGTVDRAGTVGPCPTRARVLQDPDMVAATRRYDRCER